MKKWTDQQIQILKINFDKMEYRDLAVFLGKTEGSVRNKVNRLGLRKRAEFWDDEEIVLLRKHYANNDPPDLELLERLFPGRCRSNICRKANELGLTSKNRSLSDRTKQKISSAVSEWYDNNEHPRGFSGHKHDSNTRDVIGNKSRNMWNDPNAFVNSDEYREQLSDRAIANNLAGNRSRYSRGKMGKRSDLGGLYVRSSWEANYARYLNWLIDLGEIESWEYEPDTFWFENIKRGTRSYTPDFKVWSKDGTYEYHEVKGWMDQKSKTKLSRMRKYYPEEGIVVIGADVYKSIKRDISKLIRNWE